ncbi:MAG: hypothetical protein ABS37_10900 [Acidovorax sp. SCN 65-108]|nr:MAG: hypothetical protein ABS37_10900 [Acidovorax sp. SCN 65-108]OJV66950.1 MAG: hypothetical protein BGO35_25370 [Burkholderiales bacterium 64-34]
MDKRMLLSNLDVMATAPGGVARLRELILTLAVQGKLVSQDPADEPASVLLQKIRAEKDRLMAEGKSKRDKPLAEIGEEEKPFELPQGWEWVRLGSVLSLEYGAALPEKERLPGSIPVYGSNGIVGFHTSALVSEPSLIVGRKGSVGAINISLVPFWPIDTSYFVTPPRGIELHFAFHLLRSLGLAKHDKATAIPGINRNDVYAEIVGLPPLAEQSRIVTRVEELMRLCDALQAKGQLEAAQHAQLVSTLLGTLTASATPEELAAHWQRVARHFDLLLDRPEAIDALEQTLLQLAVRGLLVPQDPTDEPASALLQKIRAEKDRLIATGQIKRDKPLPPITDEERPFELPVGWEWVRLVDVALRGPSNGLSPRPQELPTDVRCLSLSATTQGFFKPEYFKYVDVSPQAVQQFFLKNGDLLLQRGNSLEYVGIAAIYDGPDDAYIYPDLMMRLQLSECVKTEFVHTMLVSADGRSYFQRNATGTQGTMPKVNQATVAGAPIPLPPIAEQSRIVTRVTALRRLCADLRQRLADAQTTQSHLAQALVESTASV